MDWKEWFKAALIRAIKTIAQTAIATIGTAAAMGDVNWMFVGSASLLAGILSILTSIAGLPEVAGGKSPLLSGQHAKLDDDDGVDDYQG